MSIWYSRRMVAAAQLARCWPNWRREKQARPGRLHPTTGRHSDDVQESHRRGMGLVEAWIRDRLRHHPEECSEQIIVDVSVLLGRNENMSRTEFRRKAQRMTHNHEGRCKARRSDAVEEYRRRMREQEGDDD